MVEPLEASAVGALGLDGDRRWLVVDSDTGRFLTQRLLPRMTQLRARSMPGGAIELSAPGAPDLLVPLPSDDASYRGAIVWKDILRVPDAGEAAALWLSAFLERACRLVYMPDDCIRPVKDGQVTDRVSFADGYPLLLIGEGSLADLQVRVGRPLDMQRFRPNLVVSGAEPYAEDGWARIRIGSLTFRVVKPCSRCIITTLDPFTGERNGDREPLATLKTYRAREGNVYFGQNLICDGEGTLEIGMPVQVLA
ncbi:MOSC domain-containing protein [Pseudomonas sp. Marseille-QA0892]